MKQTKAILFILCALWSIGIRSQMKPIYNVPGPEVANLGQYRTIPVDLFTGTPNISIPLYTIQFGDHSLPLSASYHIASVKPTTTPGCLGLGWALVAGGYISRTVRGGIYDEKKGKDKIGRGFYYHAEKLKGMTTEEFNDYVLEYNDSNYYDLSADEFTFNFCGYSGTFYYNENKEWTVVSDQDIKVEFEPQTGFATFAEVAERLGSKRWNNSSANNCYFVKFTLVTPDGTRYEFGGLDATEFSIPYYNRSKASLIATSWMLTKISTCDGHVVKLDYSTHSIMANIQYVPQYSITYNYPTEIASPYQKGLNGFTGFLIFGVNLTSITTDSEVVTFVYGEDENYGKRFNSRAKLLCWQSTNNRIDMFLGMRKDPYGEVNQLLNIPNYNTEYHQAVAKALVCNYLREISIKELNGGCYMRIKFDYTFNKNRKLSCVSFHGASDLSTTHVSLPEYHMAYDCNKTMPLDYGFLGTDSWGYYNGQIVDIHEIPNFEAGSPSDLASMKAEVLQDMTFPTGGRCHFEFERQVSSKRVSDVTHTVSSHSDLLGGLRIRSMSFYDKDSSLIFKKRYYYSKEKTSDGLLQGSGISKGEPCHAISYILNGTIKEMASLGGFFPEITNQSSPIVGYSHVIEETQDSLGKSCGCIRYSYSNYDNDIDGMSHQDEPYLYACNASGDSPIIPYTSNSEERGKLLSKEYFDSDDKLLKTEKIRYRRVGDSPFRTALKTGVCYSSSPGYLLFGYMGWFTKTHTYSYLPTDITTTEFHDGKAYKVTTKQVFNDLKMLSRDSVLASDGTWVVTDYKYPSDMKEYNWMGDRHITSPLIRKMTRHNGKETYEFNTYSALNGLPYLQKVQSGHNENGLDTEYEVNIVDRYLNPVEITQKGRASVLIWGGRGQRLIARFDNATARQLKTLLGQDIRKYSNMDISTIDYTPLFSVRSQLPQSLVNIYTYDSRLQLVSMTGSNGFTTYYYYDYLGRLKEEYFFDDDGNKQLLKLYDYNYFKR